MSLSYFLEAMRHIIFREADTYPVAVLVKTTAFQESDIRKSYVDPLFERGIPDSGVIAFNLKYNDAGKAPAGFIKEYLNALLPALEHIGAKYLLVTDSAYFKVLTRQTKAEPHLGYVLPCKIKGYEDIQVILSLNYQQLIYDPSLQSKLDLSLDTLASVLKGTYSALGQGIIHSSYYPESYEEIHKAIQDLHKYPVLVCDIEGFSLSFDKAGIGTIAFAWNEHEGIAFKCDWRKEYDPSTHLEGFQDTNYIVRSFLKTFFESYKGQLIFHNAQYDVKCIIYTLWMQDLLDREGLLTGLDIMTRNIQDTKLIAYLATNSTAGNVLGLKALAHEYAGNWAVEEIKDIRYIKEEKLLQYNLVDCLSTWYVFKKYYPIMVQDQQEELYEHLFLPSQKVLIQTELVGMPLDPVKVSEVKAELEDEQREYLNTLQNSSVIKALNLLIQQSAMESANAKLKTKQHPLEKFSNLTFNPNSGPQLQRLLYEQMGLPVLDYTDTKQPATGADSIKKLINHTQEPAYIELLETLVQYGKVQKILSAFIPSFENALKKSDGRSYLHGSFNLGGTVSGRLSSSDPNLQNLPSGSKHGTRIKSCFSASKGWLFVGADFNALEDRINTLLTKDPNKLKVFTDGYDSHCLRSFYFFPELLPGIEETVESINSIADKFPKIRQKAKSPAFALQYAGTWNTLHNTLGFPVEQAKQIEQGYRALYKVSEAWVQERIQYGSDHGYVPLAFGLRLRCPLLKQVLYGSSSVPREAMAEARTLGNAVSGQAYGLLNNRAANEFMELVWGSQYRHDVLPVGQIHDAQYYLVRDCIDVVHWVNTHLPRCMAWQELPEIQHPEVKLGAELDIYWPSWANPITLPNEASKETIQKLCDEAKQKYKES